MDLNNTMVEVATKMLDVAIIAPFTGYIAIKIKNQLSRVKSYPAWRWMSKSQLTDHFKNDKAEKYVKQLINEGKISIKVVEYFREICLLNGDDSDLYNMIYKYIDTKGVLGLVNGDSLKNRLVYSVEVDNANKRRAKRVKYGVLYLVSVLAGALPFTLLDSPFNTYFVHASLITYSAYFGCFIWTAILLYMGWKQLDKGRSIYLAERLMLKVRDKTSVDIV